MAGLVPSPSPNSKPPNLIEFESQGESEEFRSDYSSQIYE